MLPCRTFLKLYLNNVAVPNLFKIVDLYLSAVLAMREETREKMETFYATLIDGILQ
jgi:hypothetical protein